MKNKIAQHWWRRAVFYQIYPKSFQDSNADGIGDIRGIIDRLDYLTYLGVNAIWICPVYQSPMKDNGYDISDYYRIQPEFGTIEEMKELIQKAKDANINLIMDLVVNHCSNQHAWFQDVQNNPESPYREYFIIRDGTGGRTPNNWRSVFGGSVWEKLRGEEYYYHTFTKEQPDLNWESPKLRREVYRMMNYWLDLGIKGFRIDAITFIKKEPTFQSLKPDGIDGLAGLSEVSENYPGIEVFLAEMQRETYQKRDAFSVAEISRVSDEMLTNMIGEKGVFDSIFDFSYLDMDVIDGKWFKTEPITAKRLKETMFRSQMQAQKIGGILSTVLENHDQNRSLNKFLGDENTGYAGASMLATLNLTLRGIPFLYQGEEIGMTNRIWNTWDEIDDVSTYGQYEMALQEGVKADEAFRLVGRRSRDNARTPMQWDAIQYAGFSEAKPWIPVNENYDSINVKEQAQREGSILEYYRRLIALRTSAEYGELLSEGSIQEIPMEDMDIIAFERDLGSKKIVVLLNYGKKVRILPAQLSANRKALISNYPMDLEAKQLILHPYGAIVLA